MAINVIGTRRLRDELASVLEELERVGEIVVTQRGRGKAVLVEFDRYNALLDRLEYLEDSLDAMEADRDGAVPVNDLS
jgi:prevent-host-death family protein